MATSAVDASARVTLTRQQGFHVKEPLSQHQHPGPAFGAAELQHPPPPPPPCGAVAAELSQQLSAGAASPVQVADGSGGSAAAVRWEESGARGLLSSFSASRYAAAAAAAAGEVAPMPGSGCLQPAEHAHLTPGVKRLMKGVVRGMKAFQEPEAATEGLGGTYFFSNEAGQKIAIMKPCDEEPLAPNNPKGFVGRQLGEPGLKPTVRVGEAASREVAAYLLDHDRFARVPHTVMVRMAHPVFHVQQQQTQQAAGGEGDNDDGPAPHLPCKLGSLQQFVPHDCDTSEMGASRFSVRDVQRIGILDIRLFNTDRHAGNMLVRRPRSTSSLQRMDGAALLDMASYELVPIDHGFALPEALEPPYFEWQHWPQAMLPFGREELEYIAALDAKADIKMLRQEVPSLRVESLRVLEVCTTLLKECAAAGLTLAEIAGVVTRPLIGMEEEPSELERICFNARAEVEDISDSDIEEVDEAAIEAESEEEGGNVVAMLSLEDEELCGPEGHGDAVSPTSSAASDHTDFKMGGMGLSSTAGMMSLAGSEASRLEDAVFSMDEDGNRTPPRARSPDTATARMLPPSRFAAEAAAAAAGGKAAPPAGGAAAAAGGPATPAAAGIAVSFVSPLTAGADDSLPGSFDSMSLQDSPETTAADSMSTMHGGSSLAASSTHRFCGPSSHVPARTLGMGMARVMGGGEAGRTGRPPRKTRSRRKLAIGSRLLKLTTQNYPPLVEARAAGAPSMSALAVFRDLSDEQWEAFMDCVRCQLARKLQDGAWKLAAAPKGAPMMSCPRF